MNTNVAKLQYLVDELHIPLKVLATYCKCHPSSLRAYINQDYPPTEKMLALIERGIDNFLIDFNDKMRGA